MLRLLLALVLVVTAGAPAPSHLADDPPIDNSGNQWHCKELPEICNGAPPV